MPRLPVLDAKGAEALLLARGFVLLRSKGSHRIYLKDGRRVVVPFHAGRALHPKLVKELLAAVGPAGEGPSRRKPRRAR